MHHAGSSQQARVCQCITTTHTPHNAPHHSTHKAPHTTHQARARGTPGTYSDQVNIQHGLTRVNERLAWTRPSLVISMRQPRSWMSVLRFTTTSSLPAAARNTFIETSCWRDLMRLRMRSCGWPCTPWQGKLQSTPTPPVGSQHSCQPTVKLHILPLVWIFPLVKR